MSPSPHHPLQNHPGRHELPVRASIRNIALDRTSNGQLSTAAGGCVALGVLGMVMLLQMDLGPRAALADQGWDLRATLATTDSGLLIFWAVAIIVALGFVALGVMIFLRAIRRPIREQRRYYAWHGLSAPSERLRRALRVGASWMYLKGAWPLTMEFFPTAVGLSARQVKSFRTLVPEPAEADRDELAGSWGILNAQDARESIDAHLTQGIHSLGFAATLHHEGFAAADRMAALADLPTSAIMDFATARDGHPPQLLWGWDLIRTSVIVRGSVGAGYLDEGQAVEYLETITDYVTILFPDEHDLVKNCQLGFALWAGTEARAELRERIELGDAYLAGSWPHTLGPWPTPSDRELPPAMAEGFADFLGDTEADAGEAS